MYGVGQSQVKSHAGGYITQLFLRTSQQVNYSCLLSSRQQLLLLINMASYGTYRAWNVIIPAVFAGIIWLVIFIVVLVFCFKKKKLPRIFVGMLQLSLPNIEENDSCDCVKVFGSKIKIWALKALTLLVIPLTMSTIFFSFWNVWLVEEEVRGPCLPHFDCFQIVNDKLNETPIDSCPQSTAVVSDSEITEMAAKDISYKCYRFVFLYAEGFGAAGGILLFTAIFSNIFFALLVTVSNKDGICCFVTGVILWVCAIGACVVFVVVNAAVDIIRETVFRTDNDIIQFVLYATNFLAVVVGGIVVSIGVIYA